MKNSDHGKYPIVGTNCTMNLNENTMDIKKLKKMECYYTYGNKKISPCAYETIDKEEYIVGRSLVGTWFVPGYCVSAWSVVQRINEFPDLIVTEINNNPTAYKEKLTEILTYRTNYAEAFRQCRFIRTAFAFTLPSGTGCAAAITSWDAVVDPANIPQWALWHDKPEAEKAGIGQKFGVIGQDDSFFVQEQGRGGLTVATLLDSSKGFVWPMITIYSSLLDFAHISDTDNPDLTLWKMLSFLIKVAFAIMLFFPLVALAIVLLGRVAILWVAIAASPLLILKEVFFKDAKGVPESITKYFSIWSLIKLIFAPVFVVFALSIGLIFMSTIQRENMLSMQDNGDGKMNAVMEDAGFKKINSRSFSVMWLFEIEYDGELIDKWLDSFSWMLLNFFAIGILWFLVFWAIKSNALGDKIWSSLEGIGKGIMWNLPVVPIPGKGMVWVNAASQAVNQMSTNFAAIPAEQQTALQDIEWLYGKKTQANGTWIGVSTENATKLVESVGSGKTFTASAKELGISEAALWTAAGLPVVYNAIEEYIKTKEKDNTKQAQLRTDLYGKLGTWADKDIDEKLKNFQTYSSFINTNGEIVDSVSATLLGYANSSDLKVKEPARAVLEKYKTSPIKFTSDLSKELIVKVTDDKYTIEPK